MTTQVEKRMSGQTALLVWILLPLISAFYMRGTIDPVLAPRFLLASAITVMLLILAATRTRMLREDRAFPALFFAPLLLMMLISLLAMYPSRVPSEGLFPIARLCVLLSVGIVVLISARRFTDFADHLAVSASISTFILSAVALLQYFDLALTDIPGNVIPYATMANKNLLSFAILLLIPLQALSLGERKRFSILSIIGIPLGVYVLVISETRSAYAAAAIGLALATVLHLAARRYATQSITNQSGARASRPVLVASVAAILLGLATTAFYSPPQAESLAGINMSTASLEERKLLWGKTLEVCGDNPILGCAPGNWKIEILGKGSEGLASKSGDVFYQRPHNDFLWILAETGPVGAVVYIVLILSALLAAISAARGGPERTPSTIAMAAAAGLVAWLVISAFSFPIERPLLLVLLGIYLALPYAPSQTQASANPVRRRIVLALALTGALFACAVGAIQTYADSQIQQALTARDAGLWSRVIEHVDKARSVGVQFDHTSTPLAWYRAEANIELAQADTALGDYLNAFSLNPYHLHVLDNLAACYVFLKDNRKAMKYYLDAVELWPTHEETLLNLAALYHNSGDLFSAYKTMERIKLPAKDPRYEKFMETIKSKLDNQ